MDFRRRYKARYAISMAAEIEKNVTLANGETILYSGLVRERQNWLIEQPRLLALTPLRIILLEHNLFSADWIHEIPRSVVTRISYERYWMGGFVELSYSDSGTVRLIRIRPMLRHVSETENQTLFTILSAFHSGQLKSFVDSSVCA